MFKIQSIDRQVTLTYLYIMAMAKKATKKKAAPKKRAENYEPKLKTDLSFDQLIAMSVGKEPEKKAKK
jgi:hypothetical protein